MSTSNTQIGNTPSEPLLDNNENKSNLDQLLSVEILATGQPLMQLNPTNMIPTQTPRFSNIQERGHGLRRQHIRRGRQQQEQHQHQRQRRQEQRVAQRLEHEEQRLQQQVGRRQRSERAYERWLENQYQRYPEQYREEQEEREWYEYMLRRSPTFDELMEEILEERLLDVYDLEKMDPKERWGLEQLNELEQLSVRGHLVLIQDEIEQLPETEAVQKLQEEEEEDQQRSHEQLIQLQQRKQIAISFQQLNQNRSYHSSPIINLSFIFEI